MKIHTRKRAIFMRSVDRRNDSFGADTEGFALSSQRKAQITRRNDSFGADTEGFALSSQRKAQITRRNAVSAQEPKKFALSPQRKLSVLLVVGIIILSAKECEMGPGGDKPVTFAYICTNGTKAEGTAEAENTEQCTACNTGFELTSDKQCVTEAFAYICTNGTAVDGTTGTENTEKCSSCNPGFKVHSTTEQCVESVPPAVVTLTASLPSPSVGTVKLDWSEPADADFSHLLISWTPDTPTNPIQVNKGTRTTVIPASGLTSGRAYTFTAVSVDALDNMSAASTGATATPVFSCSSPLFATTDGTTYGGSVNVASGSGTSTDPYVIPLVDGVLTTCPIEIDFDHSAVAFAVGGEYFRIDNMPTGASYTSSTLAWDFKSTTDDGVGLVLRRRIDGEIPGAASVGRITTTVFNGAMICGVAQNESCNMNTYTDDTTVMPTSARTFWFVLGSASGVDSLTLTLTP